MICSAIGMKGQPPCPIGQAITANASSSVLVAAPSLRVVLDCQTGAWVAATDASGNVLGSVRCVKGRLVVKKGKP